MEYLALIHKNTNSSPTKNEWGRFIDAAIKTRMFKGGSEIGSRVEIGRKIDVDTTKSIGGFMRFNTEKLEELIELLQVHPVIKHGGTIELCEMPKS